jgi:hypothetical protein
MTTPSAQVLLTSLRRRHQAAALQYVLSAPEFDTLLALSAQGLAAVPLVDALDQIQAAIGFVPPPAIASPSSHDFEATVVRSVHDILRSSAPERAAYRAAAAKLALNPTLA